MTTKGRATLSRSAVTAFVAAASLMAGAIHLAAADAHAGESPLFSAVFLAVGVAQAGWALLVLGRGQRALLLAGIAGSGAVLLLWIASRTIGLPFGPHPWQAEPIGLSDGVASALEVLVVLGARRLLTMSMRPASPTISRTLPPVLRASFGVLAATVIAAAWAPVIASEHAHGEVAVHASLPHYVALGAMVAALVAVMTVAFHDRPADRQAERRSA
jgi:hypothetical protein